MYVCNVGPHFGGYLVDALQTVSKKYDGDRIVRFGWMRRPDIVVISAVVFIHTYIVYIYTHMHTYIHVCMIGTGLGDTIGGYSRYLRRDQRL